MRTGRLDSPSIQIPGYVPDPNRKTKFGYKECDSEAVNSSPSHGDLTKSHPSLKGISGAQSRHSGKWHGVLATALVSLLLFVRRS